MAFRAFVGGLLIAAASIGAPEPFSPEFLRKREQWVQTVTRGKFRADLCHAGLIGRAESLLEALLQLVISDCPRDDSRWRHVACLDPEEIQSLNSIFQAHSLKKGDVKCEYGFPSNWHCP